MSVELQELRGRYEGNGTATVFPFQFTIEDERQVRVVQADALGVEKDLTFGTDYTVALNSDGTGSVTLDKVLPNGYTLALLSAIPATQERAFYNNTPYYQEQIEGGLDKTTRLIQQLQEQVERSIKVQPTSSGSPDDLVRDLFNARAEAVTAEAGARQAEQDVKAWPGRAKVLADGSTTPRALQERFADVVNVKDFGAKGDGVTDDTAAIQAAIERANALKKPIIFGDREVYKVTSSLTFTYGADFRGSTLDISTTDSVITLTTEGKWQADAEALALIQAAEADEYVKGATSVASWVNYPEISNHYIRVWTSQPWYLYRGWQKNRFDMNLVSRFGCIQSPVRGGSIERNLITRIDKLPYNRVRTYYRDVVIKLGSRDLVGPDNPVVISAASNITLENISYDIDPDIIYATSNPTLLYVEDSCGVIIDGASFIASNYSTAEDDGSASYTYCFGINQCYEVTVRRMKGYGAGWGSTGSNRGWRITYEDCALSRIDFHEPFLDYLKVIDCQLGRRGIGFTAFGDCFVERCVFNTQPTPVHSMQANIIGSRNEICGHCDGDLIMRDCLIISTKGIAIPLVQSWGDATDATELIKPKLFNSVRVSGLTVEGEGEVNLAPMFSLTGSSIVTQPKAMSFENISGNVIFSHTYSRGGVPFRSGESGKYETARYALRNIHGLRGVYFFDYTQDNFPVLVMENCSYDVSDALDIDMTVQHPIKAYITNCTFSSVTNTRNNPKIYHFTDCEFRFGDSETFIGGLSLRAKFDHCVFRTEDTSLLTLAGSIVDAVLTDCACYVEGNAKTILEVATVSGRPTTAVFPWRSGIRGSNNFVVFLYDANNKYFYLPVDLTYLSVNHPRYFPVESTGELVRVALLSATELEISTTTCKISGIGVPMVV